MVGSPSEGSMLVYMEVASDVNSFAEGGKGGRLWSEVRTSYEFFT